MNGVSLLSDDDTSIRSLLIYNYIALPLITAITPSWSFSQGNITINVSGRGFVNTSTLSCVFSEMYGDSNDTDLSNPFTSTHSPAIFVQSTLVQCIPPPVLKAKNVILDININGQDQTLDSKTFKYIKEPIVLMLSPTSGPIEGGTTLEIVGNQFSKWSNDVKCVFGTIGTIAEQRTTAIWLTTTRCKCTTPNGSYCTFSFRYKPNNISIIKIFIL